MAKMPTGDGTELLVGARNDFYSPKRNLVFSKMISTLVTIPERSRAATKASQYQSFNVGGGRGGRGGGNRRK